MEVVAHDKNCELFNDPKLLKRWLKVCKLMNQDEHFCAYCQRWVDDKTKDKKE